MEEKTYLKWYNKVGYGSGDLAGNVVYAFLSSFVMLYLTNTVGLNPGIIGTLIMLSKLFDGISDMFFGTMIDKTKSRLGKARPWMLYAYIGCAVTLVANFAIPDTLGTTAQYAWFFVAYTLLNAVFFTANNIAYASLVTFCTKNSRERVDLHGDLVLHPTVMDALAASGRSVMAVDSTQPLPDKDFKALIQDGRIRRVGVDCFDAGSVECQAAYHWQAADFSSWMDEIERFVERGDVKCYAENAFNAVSGEIPLYPLECGGRLCAEIDNQADREVVLTRFRQEVL